MRVLWLFAHPEQGSLSGSLRNAGIGWLEEAGYEVVLSGLYAMGWNPAVWANGFAHADDERLIVGEASAPRIRLGPTEPRHSGGAEEDRMGRYAGAPVSALVVRDACRAQGWFDRVFIKGFAFGVNDPETGQVLRYGQG